MKKIFIFLFISVFSLQSFSQDSFLSLSMGASFPSGDYAAKNDPFANGYAGTNFVLNFDASYVVLPYIGIGATFSFGSNFADEEALIETLFTRLGDVYSQINLPAQEDADITIDIGKWNYVNLMVGPNFSIPLNFLHIDLRALGGISFINPPERVVNIEWSPEDQFTSSQSCQVINFGYVLGAGIRFGMRGATGIRIAADYFHSKPTMEINSQHPLITEQEELIEFDLPVTTLHLTIGLSFNF